jgi:uncharacterized protein
MGPSKTVGVLRRSLCGAAGATGLILMTTGNLRAAPAFKLKDPDAYFAEPAVRALIEAARAGDEARVRRLVAEGADPNQEGPQGQPNRLRPLHYVVAANDGRAARLLMAVGADPEMDTAGFGSAFIFALVLDNLPMLGMLLELRPPARMATETQRQVLFQSVRLPRPRALALLLQAGIPIDLENGAGNTVFLQALAAQDFEMAEWLLQQGAAVVREPTPAGLTPANAVQFHLGRVRPGSPGQARLLRMQAQMQAKGAVFPAPTPEQVRASRGKN